MDQNHNFLFKVVLIGDSGVGKSNLMTRYTNDDFSENSPSTIGVEFMTKGLMVADDDVKVQIWDTAGQERFRAISRSIYHGAKGAMVVYDIANQASFDHIPNWLNELKTHVQQNTTIMLIGNKCDLEHLRVVKKETAANFARDNGLSFLETSALNNSNVEKAFEWLVKEIHEVVKNGSVPQAGKPEPEKEQVGGQKIQISKEPTPQEPGKKKCCGGGKKKE